MSDGRLRGRMAPLELDAAETMAEWFEEPELSFAGGRRHVDPKVGISLYGPRSLGTVRHKSELHVGFIGTAEPVAYARAMYERFAEGIDGDESHVPFPGFKADRGFRCDLRTGDAIVEHISRKESVAIDGIKSGRERFEEMVGLLRSKMELLTQRDYPPDYVVLALPHDLYKRCRVANYKVKGAGTVHRDLRRAFKAMAMEFRVPTQILLPATTGLARTNRKLDHESMIAWNLLTGAYFKAGGLPWGPVGLPAASCIVGVSFFRPLGSASTLRTSVVQAFDENGEGLVLRGHDFHWDEAKQGLSPHLTEEMAGKLIAMVLRRYQAERGQSPRRVVVHKSSRFEPAERDGFEQALSGVDRHDLLALRATSESRLVRAGRYPPLRGTSFTLGDISYLYTTGYVTSFGGYPHGHVPSPLRVADHVGDTFRANLLREVLLLTKMNWNTSNMSALMPITLSFSRVVGDVLREVPSHRTPQPQYRYYM
jgi:hypothetical protein